jgi:hypothetical protein
MKISASPFFCLLCNGYAKYVCHFLFASYYGLLWFMQLRNMYHFSVYVVFSSHFNMIMQSVMGNLVDDCVALKTVEAVCIQLLAVIVRAAWVTLMKQGCFWRWWWQTQCTGVLEILKHQRCYGYRSRSLGWLGPCMEPSISLHSVWRSALDLHVLN